MVKWSILLIVDRNKPDPPLMSGVCRPRSFLVEQSKVLLLLLGLAFFNLLAAPPADAQEGKPAAPMGTADGKNAATNPLKDEQMRALSQRHENGHTLTQEEERLLKAWWDQCAQWLANETAKAPYRLTWLNPSAFDELDKLLGLERLKRSEPSKKQLQGMEEDLGRLLEEEREEKKNFLLSHGLSEEDYAFWLTAHQCETALRELEELGRLEAQREQVRPAPGDEQPQEKPKQNLRWQSFTPEERKRLLEIERKLSQKGLGQLPSPQPPAVTTSTGASSGSDWQSTWVSQGSPLRTLTMTADTACSIGALAMNFSGDGESTRSVNVAVSNNTPFDCLVSFPTGTCLIPKGEPQFQTMMLIQPCKIAVPSNSSQVARLKTICADSKILRPPPPVGSPDKLVYRVGDHPQPELGRFARACLDLVDTLAKLGGFKGILMLETDPQLAVQLSVWQEAGSRTPSTADDLTESVLAEDIHKKLSAKLGRPITPEEKSEVRPSIVQMLKSIDICRKEAGSKAPLEPLEVAPATALFVRTGV